MLNSQNFLGFEQFYQQQVLSFCIPTCLQKHVYRSFLYIPGNVPFCVLFHPFFIDYSLATCPFWKALTSFSCGRFHLKDIWRGTEPGPPVACVCLSQVVRQRSVNWRLQIARGPLYVVCWNRLPDEAAGPEIETFGSHHVLGLSVSREAARHGLVWQSFCLHSRQRVRHL